MTLGETETLMHVYFASAHARSASHALHGEPPRSGGDSHGGIQNAVAFPCGNATPLPRLWRGRMVKSNRVEIVPQSSDPFQTESDLNLAHAPRALYCIPTRYAPIALKTLESRHARSTAHCRPLPLPLVSILIFSRGEFKKGMGGRRQGRLLSTAFKLSEERGIV